MREGSSKHHEDVTRRTRSRLTLPGSVVTRKPVSLRVWHEVLAWDALLCTYGGWLTGCWCLFPPLLIPEEDSEEMVFPGDPQSFPAGENPSHPPWIQKQKRGAPGLSSVSRQSNVGSPRLLTGTRGAPAYCSLRHWSFPRLPKELQFCVLHSPSGQGLGI